MFIYTNSVERTVGKDIEFYIDSFKSVVTNRLQNHDCRIENQGNIIYFERIVRYLPSSGPGKSEVLKLLREGNIVIEKSGDQRIRIAWAVKLDTLLFISIIFGIVTGFFFCFATSSFSIFLVIAIFSPTIPYCVGYFLIKDEIDEIIYSSLECIQKE